MTKPRSKVSLDKPEIETQEELLATVAEVAREMLVERDLKNALDTELQEVRDKYQADLAAASGFIERKTELVAEYCTQHPDLFPKDRKSLDLTHAVIGFRTGTPKVKLLKRWKMEAVLAAVKAKKWFDANRTTEELDKEVIIANRGYVQAEDLKSVGLEISQAETFFIEPKLEDQPAGVKVSA